MGRNRRQVAEQQRGAAQAAALPHTALFLLLCVTERCGAVCSAVLRLGVWSQIVNEEKRRHSLCPRLRWLLGASPACRCETSVQSADEHLCLRTGPESGERVGVGGEERGRDGDVPAMGSTWCCYRESGEPEVTELPQNRRQMRVGSERIVMNRRRRTNEMDEFMDGGNSPSVELNVQVRNHVPFAPESSHLFSDSRPRPVFPSFHHKGALPDSLI